jgi:hypothetical protein
MGLSKTDKIQEKYRIGQKIFEQIFELSDLELRKILKKNLDNE